MSKIVKHGAEAREAVLRGVDFLADAVKITEGPRGRNCLLGQRALGQTPKCTRDGVTVSNYVDPSDMTEQIGSDLIREAAQKTDNAVGDGTTASIVLAQAMIHAGFDFIAKGANPMAIERGIHKAVDAVVARIQQMAVKADGRKIFQVATVSAHGDAEIGKLVSGAVLKAGPDGIVTAEPSTSSETYVQTVAGLELPKSNLVHSAFITHPETMTAEWPDCRILLWEGVIGSAKSLVPLLSQVKEQADAKNVTPLLIVAGGYEQEALAVIIKARINIALPIIAVRLEAYGDSRKNLLRDIAALTGGKAFTEDMGVKIENVKLLPYPNRTDSSILVTTLVSDCGLARKVVTSMTKTQIIEGKGNQAELAGRVADIKTALESASVAEKLALRKRLAALLGGITIIKVGGVTVTEMEEKRDRVVDAMSASMAALDSGIVAGGGTALLRASLAIRMLKLPDDEQVGAQVVHAACQAVVKQIAENAGISGDFLLSQLAAVPDIGFNAMTGEFEDLVETGIIDPAKVVVESLKNAAAVSCSILTMGATVSEVRTEKENA